METPDTNKSPEQQALDAVLAEVKSSTADLVRIIAKYPDMRSDLQMLVIGSRVREQGALAQQERNTENAELVAELKRCMNQATALLSMDEARITTSLTYDDLVQLCRRVDTEAIAVYPEFKVAMNPDSDQITIIPGAIKGGILMLEDGNEVKFTLSPATEDYKAHIYIVGKRKVQTSGQSE